MEINKVAIVTLVVFLSIFAIFLHNEPELIAKKKQHEIQDTIKVNSISNAPPMTFNIYLHHSGRANMKTIKFNAAINNSLYMENMQKRIIKETVNLLQAKREEINDSIQTEMTNLGIKTSCHTEVINNATYYVCPVN